MTKEIARCPGVLEWEQLSGMLLVKAGLYSARCPVCGAKSQHEKAKMGRVCARVGGAPAKRPRFQDIPQFPRAHYRIDVAWDYLEEHIAHHSTTEGRVAALNLEPDFQRAHVWTREQQIAYVEYTLRGGEVGRNLTFNCPGWMDDWRGPYEIVDGKQRLEAARAFLRNDFKVFGHYRSEYSDRMGLAGPSFSWQVCSIESRAEVLQLYLNINAGGTPHTKEELDKVYRLLKKVQK